jgi:hypothetical protein
MKTNKDYLSSETMKEIGKKPQPYPRHGLGVLTQKRPVRLDQKFRWKSEDELLENMDSMLKNLLVETIDDIREYRSFLCELKNFIDKLKLKKGKK